MSRRFLQLTLVALGALALAGCLTRTEIIDVGADGRVTVLHLIKGHPGDLAGGAAHLPRHGYTVRAWEQGEGDEEEAYLEARASYASAEEMPTTFATADDPTRPVSLQFETSVVRTVEGGATYYRFRRTFRARDWADYREAWRRSFSPEMLRLLDSPKLDLQGLARDQLRELVEGLITYEREKVDRWGRAALVAAGASAIATADARMDLHRALDAWFRRNVTVDSLERLVRDADGDLDDRTDTIHADVRRVVLDGIAKRLSLDAAGRARATRAYDLARSDFEISDDLRDEDFVIQVKLPGEVLRHNGTRRAGRVVEWRFDGESLRDRNVVLEAVSVVK